MTIEIKMSSVKTLCALLFLSNVYCNSLEEPLALSSAGVIKGLRAPDGNYSMFLGIPYATVDKDNPFGASKPHPKFDDVFEAHDNSAFCPQLDEHTNTLKGSLDCLQLNVFAPNQTNPRRLLPVLVFIHGGRFQTGSKYMFFPKFLVRHDVVLVTINYRLGPYGFMCLDTPEFPGNQGLKDQKLALKWIHNNIEAFGGDPSQVTLFGQSAGAASIDLFLMYPGKILFNKVIMDSGNGLIPETIMESNRTKPIELAKYFGYKTNDFNEAVRFLAKVDTHSLIEAALERDIVFVPCVEKKFKGVKRFIAKHPVVPYRPHVKNMPVLTGSNNKELLGQYIFKDLEYFQREDVFRERLGNIFDFGEYLDSKSDMVRNFYVGNAVQSEHDKRRVIDFDSDISYIYTTQRPIRTYIRSGAENVYYYEFSYAGGRNLLKYNNDILDAPGAANTDELGYLFDIPYPFMTKKYPTPADQAMIDRMTTMWTNFAKYGNPTPYPSRLLPVEWLPVTSEHWHSLSIDSALNLIGRPFRTRMAFWTKFYKEYGRYQRGVNATNEVLCS